MNLKGQQKKVYDYLAEHGEATVRELFTNLYINHPPKQIEMLRHKGIDIKTIPVQGQKYEKYVLQELRLL